MNFMFEFVLKKNINQIIRGDTERADWLCIK